MSPAHVQPSHYAPGAPQGPQPGQLPPLSAVDVRQFPGFQMPPSPMPNNGNDAMIHQNMAQHMMEVREHMMHMMHLINNQQPHVNSGSVQCFEFMSQDDGPLMMMQRERQSGHLEQQNAHGLTRQQCGPSGRKHDDGNAMSTIMEQAPYTPAPGHPCTVQWHNGSAEQFLSGPLAFQRATGCFGVRDQVFNMDGPIIGAQNGRAVRINDNGVLFIDDMEVGRMSDNATEMCVAQLNGDLFVNGNYLEPVPQEERISHY